MLTADGDRVGLEPTYLPGARFPDLIGVFDPTTSLYAFLRDELGVEFGPAAERLETVLATPREALSNGSGRCTAVTASAS